MVVMYFFFVLVFDGIFYVVMLLFGICYGIYGFVIVLMVFEFFGFKYFGIISNFMGLGNLVGVYLFLGLFVGYLYDKEVVN